MESTYTESVAFVFPNVGFSEYHQLDTMVRCPGLVTLECESGPVNLIYPVQGGGQWEHLEDLRIRFPIPDEQLARILDCISPGR
jgi:hypothetical protein